MTRLQLPDFDAMFLRQEKDAKIKLLQEWFSFFVVQLQKAYDDINKLEEEKAQAQAEHVKIVDELTQMNIPLTPDIQSVTFEIEQDQFVNDWGKWFEDAEMTIINFFTFDAVKEKNYTLEPVSKRIVVWYIPSEPWVSEMINLMKGGGRANSA